MKFPVFSLLPSATKLRRLCFYKRVSVHGGGYLTRYPPGPGTPPWDQVHPPRTRYTPRDQVHPLGPGTPPVPGTPTPQIRLLLRTVRILLECILVIIKLTPWLPDSCCSFPLNLYYCVVNSEGMKGNFFMMGEGALVFN